MEKEPPLIFQPQCEFWSTQKWKQVKTCNAFFFFFFFSSALEFCGNTSWSAFKNVFKHKWKTYLKMCFSIIKYMLKHFDLVVYVKLILTTFIKKLWKDYIFFLGGYRKYSFNWSAVMAKGIIYSSRLHEGQLVPFPCCTIKELTTTCLYSLILVWG